AAPCPWPQPWSSSSQHRETIPLIQAPRLIDTSQIPDPAKRLDEVNGLRTNLLGVLAGLAVAAGAVMGALNLVLTQRVQWRAQVTERFTRAIDQLGSEKLDVRIGAVYALEQIARDSAELHWPITEVLTAYLREHAQPGRDLETAADEPVQLRPPADHQAIATVIGRRRCEQHPADQWLNLHGATLPGVEWREAHLGRANLSGAHLEQAHLSDANLEGADLIGATGLARRARARRRVTRCREECVRKQVAEHRTY